MYLDYLVHYNKNHSKANGQFVSGDGDGDGVVNDHANQKKQLTPEEKKRRAKRNAWIAVGAGAAGTAVAAAALIITKNHKKKMTDRDYLEKVELGQSFLKSSRISNTPLLSATAWTQEKISTDAGKVTRKEFFEAPKRWNASFHTTGYGNSDVRIFDVKSPAKGTWGKNRTWGWD